jgi:hypothetical protein
MSKETIKRIGLAGRPSSEYNAAKASSNIFHSILLAKMYSGCLRLSCSSKVL